MLLKRGNVIENSEVMIFNNEKSQKHAIVLALASVFFWATIATAFKIALRDLSPWQIIFIASITSLFVFLLLILASGKVKQIVKLKKNELLRFMLLGFLNPFAYYLVLLKAYDLNPAQITQSVNMIWPVVLAFMSVPLLGHTLSSRNIYAVLISFTGVLFIASQGSIAGFSNTNLWGVLMAAGTSIVWALYWIFNVKSSQDKLIVLFWNFLFGTLYLFLFGLIVPETNFKVQITPSFWAAVYVGFFELGITYRLWMKALEKSTNNAVTGNFIFLAPFFSLIFIYFILNEKIYGTTFVGLSLILSGIFIQQIERGNATIRKT